METQAYFEDIQFYIGRELQKAKKSIIIAVAWFTDRELYDLLCQKAAEGVQIEILLANDNINKGSYGLNFEALQSQKGAVHFIGNDKLNSIMHNKFCVIDHEIIITGSYNWSRQAQKNYENITVIRDNSELARQFIKEFYNIKNRFTKGRTGEDLSHLKILNRLEAIRNLILLEDEDDIQRQTAKLKNLLNAFPAEEHLTAVRETIPLIESGNFEKAIKQIDDFIRNFKQIAVYIDPELLEAKFLVNVFEIQLSSLQDEKAELEKVIRSFQIRYTNELGDITLKILGLKKEKLREESNIDPSKKEAYEEACRDYDDYNQTSEKTKKEKIYELTEEEQIEVKSKYRRASRLCHPDVVSDAIKDKAANIFNVLTLAYKQNDLKRVSEILHDLEKGKWLVPLIETINETSLLKAEVIALRTKISAMVAAVIQMKDMEPYLTINKIQDLDTYFTERKEQLLKQLDALEKQNVQALSNT